MTKLPLVRLKEGQADPDHPRRSVTARQELLLIWDLVTATGQADILSEARRVADGHGLKTPEGDGPAVRTGKR